MDLEKEITKYLDLNPNKTTPEIITFLIKLWNSASLQSSTKYDVIMNYFAKHLLLKVLRKSDGGDEVKKFLMLMHPVGSVSAETKKEMLDTLTIAMSTKASFYSITVALNIAAHHSFKDFFKTHLDTYSDFMLSVIKCFKVLVEADDKEDQKETDVLEMYSEIMTELYCFAKNEEFKTLFLDTLVVPLASIATIDNSHFWELLKTLFFSHLAQSDCSLEIFERDLPQGTLTILMDAFIAINKSKQLEISKLMLFIYDHMLVNDDSDVDFLHRTKQAFLLLQHHGVDLAPIKRQEPALFEKLSTRVTSAIEASKDSMDFADYMLTLSSFIECDAFLFQRNIHNIITDCMLQEKSPAELTSYEALLSIVVKIYGKDMNQFLRKLLKIIEVKLETFNMPKKRKRKLQSGSEVTPKKRKISETSSEVSEDFNHIAHIWPTSMSETFAEIVAGLTVSQSIKVWSLLNEFLAKALQHVKESSTISENSLFKIDFATNLLCELFTNTRLLEQLMYKREQILASADEFNKTLSLFSDLIVNIEYNCRVMNAFLKLTSSYENFLMLYCYHHSPEDKSDLSTLFASSQSKSLPEWSIIQQRIKNFGKNDEKNKLNSLIIQQQLKNQLFSGSEVVKFEDVSSILGDEKQIDFLLLKSDTRAFFINSLGNKELKTFAQYLIAMDNKELQATALNVIAQSSSLLNGFIDEVLDGDFEAVLGALNQLPLPCVSDENRKKIFSEILSKQTVELFSLIKSTTSKLFSNDSYKTFFKDFKIQQVVEVFEDITQFTQLYQLILNNAARRMNDQTLLNFEWILKKGDLELLEILAQTVSEVPLSPASGVTAENLTQFKLDIIQKLLVSFKSESSFDTRNKSFAVLARLCSDNSAKLKDESKAQYLELLQNFLKQVVKSPNTERVKLLLMTLKDAKKFNINDEIKGTIVESLLAYLKTTLREKLLTDTKDFRNVDLETQLFAALKPFKSNYQEGCVEIMRQILIATADLTSRQIQYSFKIYQIAFETKTEDKSSGGIIKKYLKFYDDFVPKAVSCADNVDAIIQILETNNSMLNERNFQLDNTTIDDMMSLLTDPRIKPSEDNIGDFCRFYGAVGEALFVIANVRQNYFKSRISQYFNVYRSFMEATYFFRNDQPGELTPMEASLLLKLALQLENIMKMILKVHAAFIKIVSLYIASSVVDIFVKNPKTLSIGYKFKVNIKNICYQLLSTFDDKTRKHVYSVADETTREVYDGLFMEIRRRA